MSHTVAVEETRVARWSRRLISIPGYITLGVIAVATLPLTLPLAFITDLLRGHPGRVATRCVLALTLYLSCEVLGILASLLLWLSSLVVPGRERFQVWNLYLQRIWASTLFGGATRLFGMKVRVTGAECADHGPLLVFSRHASTIDTLLPVLFASHPKRLRLAYVMKRELLWDPCLDIVGQRTRNAFIRRGSGAREKELALLRQLAATMGDKDAVLLFPEGTRFSEGKRRRLLEELADGKHPELLDQATRLTHVLPPRRSGALTLLETSPGTDVVFLAHTGLEGMENLNHLWRGALIGRTIHLALWRVPAADIPKDEAGRVAWLNGQWEKMNHFVDEHPNSKA